MKKYDEQKVLSFFKKIKMMAVNDRLINAAHKISTFFKQITNVTKKSYLYFYN
jgi:hypothetical protein